MKIQHLSRKEWDNVKQKNRVTKEGDFFGKKCTISLFTMDRGTKPFVVIRNGIGVEIVKEGISWLQIAPHKEYFWLTAMFNKKGDFFELYADITNGNHTEADDPYFEDMYLDFILTSDGVQKMDENELLFAYQTGKITARQYHKAEEEGEKVYSFLCEQKEEILNFLFKTYREMNKKG